MGRERGYGRAHGFVSSKFLRKHVGVCGPFSLGKIWPAHALVLSGVNPKDHLQPVPSFI